MHHNLDRVQPFVDHEGVGDLGRNRLDEIAWRARDDVGRALGQGTVVEGVGKVVGFGRPAQIHPGGDVDDEFLTVTPFMLEDAMVAANP